MSKDAVIPYVKPDTIFDEVEFYGGREVRWYQVAAKHEAVYYIEHGVKRVLIVMPTGSGKTLTIACTIGSPELKKALNIALDEKLRIMFVAHVGRLLTQAERLFAEENNVELIIQSTMSAIPQETIDRGWHITVLDEAHHEATASMQYQLETLLGDIPLIGLTATPDRADGMVIKFEKIVNPISREQAVAEGWLAETNLYTIVDGSERSKASILCDIFDTYSHQMAGTLVFVRTKKECALVAKHLTDLGYTTVGLVDQKGVELDRVLDAFSRGEIQFIVSCNKLGEGIDVVGCNTVVLGRTIGSYSLLNQIIGRGARPDCDCNVFEIVNPLSSTNLDTTCVVGTPKNHILIHYAKGAWQEEIFDYSSNTG